MMICKRCGMKYELKESKRKYGDAIYIYSYCSPQCYTQATQELNEKQDGKTERKLEVLILAQEYGSKMLDMASARCLADPDLIKKHLKEAKEIMKNPENWKNFKRNKKLDFFF